MKMKIVIVLSSIILLIGVLYVVGFRISSTDFIYRHIPFNKVKDIKCGFWKNAGDGHIGDFLNFENPERCRIVNDTLYFGNEPKAIVIKLIQRNFVGDYTMTLIRISDGEECYYVSK